jgi:hypothetical protein
MIGAAIDYSRANNIRSGIQAALDAAIIAGARDGTSNWASVALNTFTANAQSKGGVIATPSFSQNQDGSFIGAVAAQVGTTFIGILGTSSISLNAHTAAVTTGSHPGQFCILALNGSASSALKLTGNATIDVNAPQCVVQVNSNNASAVFLSGNASIESSDNCFVGSVVKSGNATLSPAPNPMCKPVPDPFATYTRPSVGPCDYINYSASGNKSITLQPGVYCGGMQFSGQVNVTFASGTYIIKDGVLSASGGSAFTGNGVSFYLTGQGAGVQISGQADWQITATSSGPFAGFVFFLDAHSATGIAASSSQITGSGQLYFEGVIYLPQQLLTLTGGSQAATPSPYTAFIADTFDLSGNGTVIINSDPTKTTVPIPSQLLLALGGQPRLTQ